MGNVIIVSSDSHAGMPNDLWTKYLDPRFHDLLPSLREDLEMYPMVVRLLTARRKTSDLPELRELHATGWHGLHDARLRLEEMDREGVAAELIYHGDSRLGDLFHNNTSRKHSLDAWEAGARAWNRWAADNFGFAMDRFLVVAAVGPCHDMDSAVAELDWIADHDFAGTYAPGYLRHADMPPLSDASWEPYFAKCAERGLALVAHAGYGLDHGVAFEDIENMYRDAVQAAGSTDPEALLQHADAIDPKIFGKPEFFSSVGFRRALWQLTLSGVFDRHPELKVVLTEIRADWVPATLRHLDAVFEEHRAQLPAKRKPSEYWSENFLVGASFIHKAEVEMRHEIGLETISFGRDYPHPESTWPHTKQWLRDALGGIPERDIRLILGENAIRFLGLDAKRLGEIADRIGFGIDEITGSGPETPPELLESFDQRGGYLKPSEGDARVPEVEAFVREDLSRAGVNVGAS